MAKKSAEPSIVEARDPASLPGTLKRLGGSASDDWNSLLANQAMKNQWRGDADPEWVSTQRQATIQALIGIAPKDELEGMMAAQLIAAHHASMDCYRRAMLREHTFDGWREALAQASKLSRTYATLLDALNRHRGKGQQKVTVEHVHVHQGGQAIVGNVQSPGGGLAPKSREQPHALAYAPGTPVPCPDTPRDAVPVAGHAERPLPDARRPISGRAKG